MHEITSQPQKNFNENFAAAECWSSSSLMMAVTPHKSLHFCGMVTLISVYLVFFLDLIVPAASCSCKKTSCSFLSLWSNSPLPIFSDSFFWPLDDQYKLVALSNILLWRPWSFLGSSWNDQWSLGVARRYEQFNNLWPLDGILLHYSYQNTYTYILNYIDM